MEDFLTVNLLPWGGDEDGIGILLSDESNAIGEFTLGGLTGVREDDRGCVLNLVVVELAKVLHIHFALVDIDNNGVGAKLCIGAVNTLYRLDNVGELSDTRGLNDDAVGMKFVKHTAKCGGKITDKRAADTARIHLGNLDASITEEAAVNTDFAKLVFDKDEFFTDISLGDEFFYESGLSRTEKAGKNIYFRHFHFSAVMRSPCISLQIVFYYLFVDMSRVLRCFCAKKYIFPSYYNILFLKIIYKTAIKKPRQQMAGQTRSQKRCDYSIPEKPF